MNNCALPDLFEKLCKTMSNEGAADRNNRIVRFIDWIILKNFSELNDHNTPIPQLTNPFKLAKGGVSATESVRSPLPYWYIKELRTKVCPKPSGHFNDWIWIQGQTGQQRSNGWKANLLGDWFEVPSSLIDSDDPDCVWRKRIFKVGEFINISGERHRLKETYEKYEMCSAVSAVVIYIKLHLPLRTYQIRMLDSGEADARRYHHGFLLENKKHDFVTDYAKRNKGVFHRILSPEIGEVMTGIYISTNKTADQNKEELERGYIIAWQHDEVLYWLEKL